MSISYRVYPHNDLLNLANYHLEILNDKVENGVKNSIALDCTSVLISLAFSVEAIVNYVGYKCIKEWKERQPFHKKMEEICESANISINAESDLFEVINQLKIIRDSIAHGKPIEGKTDDNFSEGMNKYLKSPWDEYLNPEFTNLAYESVKEFKNLLFSRYKIKPGTALTSAAGWG